MINKKKKWACLADLKEHLVKEQKETVIDFNGWRLEMEDAVYYMKFGEIIIQPKEVKKSPEKSVKKGKKRGK